MENEDMRFVGIFDLLGFKNLVKSQSLKWLKDTFNKIISQCAHGASKRLGHYQGSPVTWELAKFVRFSDTIIFYTDDGSDTSLVRIVESANLFLFESLASGFPVRGAITHGELYAGPENNLENFVGRGIVDAYELEKEQEWSGAIIDPKVVQEKRHETVLSQFRENHRIIEYEVPLKRGEVKKRSCIEWPAYYWGGFTGSEPSIRECFTEYYDGPITWDIERKIQNTDKFSRYCKVMDHLPD